MASNGHILVLKKGAKMASDGENGLETPLSSKLDHFCKDIYEGKLFQILYISVL